MSNIQFKECDSLSESLGIPTERHAKIEFHIRKSIHNLLAPKENPDEQEATVGDILKALLAEAQNEQEQVYLAYRAGLLVYKMKITDNSHISILKRLFGA